MDTLVAALAARRYYLEGRSKVEVAQELGVSRFKVARILEQALQDGVVTITVHAPDDVDLDLSTELVQRFGLRQAVVVRSGGAGEQEVRRRLGRACATVLAGRLTEDDVLGLSWGRTLQTLADELPALPAATTVQMVGSVPGADLDTTSMELVRRVGHRTGGPVQALHVPMLLEDPALVTALRATRSVAATLRACDAVTAAVVGVGAWGAGGSSSLRDALPVPLAQSLERRGAVADVCSTVLDEDGGLLSDEALLERCIAVTPEQLAAITDVTAVAGGAAKAPALSAVLRTPLVHRLVTDDAAAHALLGAAT